jgi:hypothetical protein
MDMEALEENVSPNLPKPTNRRKTFATFDDPKIFSTPYGGGAPWGRGQLPASPWVDSFKRQTAGGGRTSAAEYRHVTTSTPDLNSMLR